MSAGAIRRVNSATSTAGKSVSSLLRSAAAAKHHGRTPVSFSSFSACDSFSAASIAAPATVPAHRLRCGGENPSFGVNDASAVASGNAAGVGAPPRRRSEVPKTENKPTARGLTGLSSCSSSHPGGPGGTPGVCNSGKSTPSRGGGTVNGGGGLAPLSGARRTVSSLLSPAAASAASPLSPTFASGDTVAARVDVVVIGAGQAGLSAAYYLQKAGGLRLVTLDANQVLVNDSTK